MEHDFDRLRLSEMTAISKLLHDLSDEQWDAPSLCEGWRVRDVVSHMCVGYTTPMPTMLAKIARRRFDIPKASFEESIAGWTAGDGPEIEGDGVDELRAHVAA